ncbi:MAG TPA: MurR/RpiR family transcriptional regulator [Thermodesulfobacteriota bacterium]
MPRQPAHGGSRRREDQSIAELIHRRLDRLTRSERAAARTLLAGYPMAGLESLTGFAQRAGVSHPTVLRFVAKLGYSGYPGFQAALRKELEARLKSPLNKGPAPSSPARNGSDSWNGFAEAVCANIRQSLAAIPRHEVDAVAALLAAPQHTVYLLGGRFTDAIAHYTYMHLRALHPRVAHVTGPPVAWSEYLLNMGRRSVLVVFDIRRYQDDVVSFARRAAERGARVVLVTDQWLSPIAAVAEHVFVARIEVPSRWDSSAALLVLMEALIARINDRYWQKVQGRLEELERLRAAFGPARDGRPST